MLPICCCFFLQLIDLTVLTYPHCIMIGEVLLLVEEGGCLLREHLWRTAYFFLHCTFFFARSSLEYHSSSITSKWDPEAYFTKTAFISFLILNILISRWRLKMIEELVFFYQIKKWPNTRKTKFFKKKIHAIWGKWNSNPMMRWQTK